MFPGTLEARGTQFWTTYSWFNIGKLVHCPRFPLITRFWNSDMGWEEGREREMPQIWMRFRDFSAPGHSNWTIYWLVGQFASTNYSGTQGLARSEETWCMLLKTWKRQTSFSSDSGSKALERGVGMIPRTLEALGSQFWATIAWFSIGKLVHCPRFPYITCFWNSDLGWEVRSESGKAPNMD